MPPENPNSFLPVARDDDSITFRNQNSAQSFADCVVVIHDKDGVARQFIGQSDWSGFVHTNHFCFSVDMT